MPSWKDYQFAETKLVEEHVHNVNHMFPQTTDADGNEVADFASLVTVTTHADANRFGSWTKVADQTDLARFESFDPSGLFITGATGDRFYNIQIGYGDGTLAGTEICGQTELNTEDKLNRESPVHYRCLRCIEDGSSHLYVRITSNVNPATDSFDCNIDPHGYPPVAVVHG